MVLIGALYLRNKTFVPVFYHKIKYRYELGCVLLNHETVLESLLMYYQKKGL